MPQPADSNRRHLSTEDAFLKLLIDTLETLERPARGQFLQRFSRPITHVDLTETQGLDLWVQALGYGRMAFETTHPEKLEEAFHAVLHVPILPSVRVNLRRVYQSPGSTGTSRIGCSFVT